MIKELRFVQGAIATKDYVPALTHFRISNGTVRGFNGQLAICSPIDLEFDVAPNALQFIKAIDACSETISVHIAKNGKLVLNSGNFKAQINCVDPTSYPDILPEGQIIKLDKPILPALQYLQPFIAEDASRPWACGIYLNGQFAHATNNIIAIQYWLGCEFPRSIIIPKNTVKELIRVKEEPAYIQLTENRLTFHYENASWIMSNLLEGQWPNLDSLLNKHLDKPSQKIEPSFWEALKQIEPFTDELNRCYFKGTCLATGNDPDLSEASVRIDCPNQGIVNTKQLLKLCGIADKIGLDCWPDPMPFYGEMVRGIVAGIRH